MIYESLLVPTECASSLREIKRLLLTYDKVLLIDPSDRDMMPGNAVMAAIMGFPLIGFPQGPAARMGKLNGYDDEFDRLTQTLSDVMRQGLVEVVSTYKQAETQNFTIGGIPLGGYPLDTRAVFWIYRNLASNLEFLAGAVEPTLSSVVKELQSNSDLAIDTSVTDGGINDIPALPPYFAEGLSDPVLDGITKVARARLGALVKYCGFCEAKNLVPILPSKVYGRITSTILNNARGVFADSALDHFWMKRNLILEVCHEEYMFEQGLDDMSVSDVISLRTRAWSNQATGREKLMQAAFELTENVRDEADFEKAIQPKIREYRKASEDVVRERAKLRVDIKCDLAKGVIGGGEQPSQASFHRLIHQWGVLPVYWSLVRFGL